MPKRIKKALVTPAMRRDWLKRLEEDGLPASEIARSDHYDVRTVRKQIELMQQEREGRETRLLVLRQALERHYTDLVSFAEKLDLEMTQSHLSAEVKNERMWSAMREHLPRSPLWKAFDRLEHLNEEVVEIKKSAEQRMRDSVEKGSSLKLVSKPVEPGLYDGALTAAVEYHLQTLPPNTLLEFKNSFIKERLTEVYYDKWACAAVSPGQVPEVKEFLTSLMTGVNQWPEYENMQRTLSETTRIISTVREELATIIWRRVIPGHCKYCPV